jgi:hypothetical protein
MKGENRDFYKIGKVFAELTENSRKNLITTAKRLLKVQKLDRAVLTDSVLLKKKERADPGPLR